MKKKIKLCPACGNEVSDIIKVPGYHWEQAEGYNWGRWVKTKREIKNARIKKDEC
jgi:hypothetical protein